MSYIPLDVLIDITSVGVKDTFTIGKLNTILIEPYNAELPNEKFTQLGSLSHAQSVFGINSNIDKFAGIYFGIISKTASKADLLFVYNWSKTDTSAILKGEKCPPLSEVKTLRGNFNVTLGKSTFEVLDIDFANCDSLTQAAELMQEKIRALSVTDDNFTKCEVSYNSITSGFIIKGGIQGEGETLGYLSAGSVNDIHNRLGLTLAEGASIIDGFKGQPDFAGALQEINENNGNFYLITPNFEFENVENDLKAFGTFLNASNDRFCGIYSWTNPLLEVLNSGATEPYKGFNGLIIDNKKVEFQNAFACGLISAMNLKNAAGNYNIAFNDASIFAVEAIDKKLKYEAMVSNKANAPAKFGILGQDDTIYMDGTILGNKTSSINVYVCNSFLKFNQQLSLYNMFKSQTLIGLRDKSSGAVIRSYIDEVFQSAVRARIIATGSTLTNTERQTIISQFSALTDDIDKAIELIENNGYFYAFQGIDTITRTLSITEAYMANAPVKKLVINTYILGA